MDKIVMETMLNNHEVIIKDNTKRINALERSSAVIEKQLETTNNLLKGIIATLISGVAVPIIIHFLINGR